MSESKPQGHASPRPVRRSGRFAEAYKFFFVAAFFFAAASVVWWTAVWMGVAPMCRSCWPPALHGHEMLLGFAAALMAGFLFTRVGRAAMFATFGLWLAGRLALVFDAPAPLLAILLPTVPLALYWWGGRPFLRAAKTPHNAVPGLAVGLLLLAEAMYIAGRLGLLPNGEHRGVLLAFALVSIMLFVMGGRLIAAASVGALRQKGVKLPQAHLVQRPWEWVGIAGLALMGTADAAGFPAPLVALGSGAAGIAALVRVSFWRPLHMRDMPDLWPLHLGYAWLGAGLLARAAAWPGLLPFPVGLHLVTVGALGCIASAVALRTTRQRAGAETGIGSYVAVAAAIFSAAALLRAAVPSHPDLLVWSAVFWSAACLWTAGGLLAVMRRSARG